MRVIPIFLCLVLTGLFPVNVFCDDTVLRVRDGAVIPFKEMIDDVKKADIVFVGEIHDMNAHHRDQLSVIRALHESDTPMAVGLEMFRADSQDTLNAWTSGRLSPARFLLAYRDNWSMPWALYRDIFLYSREHELPLIGLNIPERVAEKVARQGFDSLSREDKEALPPGTSCRVDEKYMAFIKQAYAGHSYQERTFLHFCEAQMVRDESMAWHLVAYRKKHSRQIIVVLAGVGHAWKRGVAAQMGLGAKLSIRSILPFLPGEGDPRTVTTRDADYLLLP